VDTARPLARLTGMPLVETQAVRERSVGAFTGLTFEQVESRWPDGWKNLLSRDPAYAPPDGESHVDCARRVARFVDELVARRPEGRVVVFSHGVAINHMLRHVVGIDPAAQPRFFFQVENCSLHRVQRLDDGLFRILATNDVSHLEDGLLSYG
jgi:probable phosphoglycerate mutase